MKTVRTEGNFFKDLFDMEKRVEKQVEKELRAEGIIIPDDEEDEEEEIDEDE